MVQVVKKPQPKKGKVIWALVARRPREEDGSGCNATTVAEIISCMTARNGKRSRGKFVPRWEKISPAHCPYGWVTGMEPLD